MGQKRKEDWRDALAALVPADSASAPESVTESGATSKESKSADTLTIFFERKGRGGKQATIIAGFTCNDDELKETASALKQRLATGGSARGGEILIQGDRRDDCARELRKMGFKVKG